MAKSWRANVCGVLLAACVLVSFALASEESKIPDPTFREDLHRFGYPRKPATQGFADYTDLAFLSENQVLVSVNIRAFTGGAEPLNTVFPESTLLLFDVTQKKLLGSSRLPIEKFRGSVRAIHDGKFVVLQGSEIWLCHDNLECGPSRAITGDGPLFVSPRGTRIVAGGNGRNPRELLDGDSLEVLNQFPFGQPAMPGDAALLSVHDGQVCVVRDGFPEELLGLPSRGVSKEAQFLSDGMFAIIQNEQMLSVVGLDGRTVYHISILPYSSGTDIVPSASGNRFCVHQKAYMVWGSKLSVASDHKTRTVDIYRVFDTSSGTEIAHLQWDPRPYLDDIPAPAVSPSGHRLAVIRSGYLEVFDLP